MLVAGRTSVTRGGMKGRRVGTPRVSTSLSFMPLQGGSLTSPLSGPHFLSIWPQLPRSARFRVLWPCCLFPDEDSVLKTCTLLPSVSHPSARPFRVQESLVAGALGMDSPILTHPLCPRSPESLRPLGECGGWWWCQCHRFFLSWASLVNSSTLPSAQTKLYEMLITL